MADARVAIVMGSDSDWPVMRRCVEQLRELGIQPAVEIMSAHRGPDRVHAFARSAKEEGFSVIIAAAGLSAALAGTVAAHTTLPVIGVPLASGPLSGIDALLSTVQMPPGIPVAGMGIGEAGAVNAAVLAAQIVALHNPDVEASLARQKSDLAKNVEVKNRTLQEMIRADEERP